MDWEIFSFSLTNDENWDLLKKCAGASTARPSRWQLAEAESDGKDLLFEGMGWMMADRGSVVR